MTSRNPDQNEKESLKGVYPNSLRNVCFVKKHKKKGLKKMQAHNAKATDTHAEVIKAPVKPMEVKAKIPMAVNCKLRQLAYMVHPKLGKRAQAHISKSLRLCWSKAKA
ncbi:large ribosomal subunit protein eL29-like [Tenrec ecaudatus]|uniref:large ribosomal subunit protein eL29-like n=1 Tax=Tenrec ecaudatus TaxID=94439 RepID=UPI003F5A5061